METLIGLALGRATIGAPVDHEQHTIDFLADLGRALDEGTLDPNLGDTSRQGAP